MAKSKIDKAVGSITESEIKSLHKGIKPRKEYDSLRFFKNLTIIAVILIIIFIFLFWKFNVVDLPTFRQYGGKSKVHLLSYCGIEKFKCKTSKLENGSITLDIKNNFNEIAAIKEVSFGDCTKKYDITLGSKGSSGVKDKASIEVFCKSYKDMKVVYQRERGIEHKSEGKVFYFLDLTRMFKVFYKG
ncbi:MAG: hypothetical protein AABX65_02310 [Nanoarchaeota archaeon]